MEMELINRKPYPGILSDVFAGYDPVRKTYYVKLIYKVYHSPEKTTDVVVNYNLWDYNQYREVTNRRLEEDLSKFGVKLISRDYRNESSIVNACKWLVGTRVEIMQYKYRTVRYAVVSTERTSYERIDALWGCLLQNRLDDFPKCLELKNGPFSNFFYQLRKDNEKASFLEKVQETGEDEFSDFNDILNSNTPVETKQDITKGEM